MASVVGHIEELPTELLQSIFVRLDESNLLSLRLTCKTLSDAAFDIFAAQYLREVVCFLPDPARLSRLLYVTSRPHLLKKMRIARLTLDAFEGRYLEVAFVPPVKEEDTMEYDFAQRELHYEDYRLEQLDHCCASTPSLEPLRQILAVLHPTRCKLSLEFAGRTIRAECCEKVEALVWETLNLIAKASIPIHQFSIWPLDDHNARSIGEILPSTMTRHVRQFSFLSPTCRDPSGQFVAVPESVPQAKIKHSMEEMCSVLASMEHLEYLRISMWQFILEDDVVQLTAKMLLSNTCMHLRQLKLYLVRLPGFNSLLGLFSRCQNTLDSVFLLGLTVYSGPNLWPAVFESLQVMPSLRRCDISDLAFGATNSQFFDVEEACDCHLAFFHPLECSAKGVTEIRAALTRFRTNGIRLGDESIISNLFMHM